jgi:hypothetical protein
MFVEVMLSLPGKSTQLVFNPVDRLFVCDYKIQPA